MVLERVYGAPAHDLVMSIQQHTIETPYMVGPVHCYSAEIEGELVLFDTGPPTEKAKSYLQNNIDLSRLKHVFITHCHIDHYGLVHWLEEVTDAQIYIPYRDGLKILSHEERLNDMYLILQKMGFSGTYLRDLHGTLSDGRIFPPFPKKFRIVEDDMPDHLGLQTRSCPGHSQSDIVYCSESWAVTGDVLLKGVFQSPLLDVDLETGERFRNYLAYCATVKKLADLRGKTICPAHRKPIDSVDDTIVFYVSKMLDRAAQLKRRATGSTVPEIVESLFGDVPNEPFFVYLKASEVAFIQDFFAEPDLLKHSLEDIGLFERLRGAYEKLVFVKEYQR